MHFGEALDFVLEWEGGYADHPADPGGATNLGVTRKSLSDWRGRPVSIAELRALTAQDAAPLYEALYWNECRCSELPHGVDLLTFDCAVNQGPSRAKRFLQRALGVAADGVLGPITMSAALRRERIALVDEIAALRAAHYASLDQVFHLGWFRRLIAVHRRALG